MFYRVSHNRLFSAKRRICLQATAWLLSKGYSVCEYIQLHVCLISHSKNPRLYSLFLWRADHGYYPSAFPKKDDLNEHNPAHRSGVKHTSLWGLDRSQFPIPLCEQEVAARNCVGFFLVSTFHIHLDLYGQSTTSMSLFFSFVQRVLRPLVCLSGRAFSWFNGTSFVEQKQ